MMYTNWTHAQVAAPDLVIRLAPQGDPETGAAIRRLAQLDSARPPTGPVLLAQRGDRPIAAYSLHDGAVVADPFEPTADAVKLLAVRARQLAATEPRIPLADRLRGYASAVVTGPARSRSRS